MTKNNFIADELKAKGMSIVPDFISLTLRKELLADLIKTKNNLAFHKAGIGNKENLQIRSEIRQDEIFWLDENSANAVQKKLWKKIHALRKVFNQKLFLGLNIFEGHYAVYPPGGFYKKHFDSFRNDAGRKVTFILYLNENWKEEDGGQLRIHLSDSQFPESQDKKPLDIIPLGGKLVCFLSADFEHEVLKTTKPRYSFGGWFKN